MKSIKPNWLNRFALYLPVPNISIYKLQHVGTNY